ncbi:MAG: hypothetical protein H7A55_00025 [Verrucomicrobiaceae bacterium]|nr:hypothetical protein [Verrucomicrobiaceae bacterium]
MKVSLCALLTSAITLSSNSALAITPPMAFATYPSHAKTGYSIQGIQDLATGRLGTGAVSPNGDILFEMSVVGTGAAGGRSRALCSNIGFLAAAVRQQSGPLFPTLPGLPANARITAFSSPIVNRTAQVGIYRATVTGTGLNSASNQLVLRCDNGSPGLVARTGVPFASLGGAVPSSFLEVLQQEGANDRVALLYKLRSGVAATNTKNDSGLILMNHAGTVTHSLNREGNASAVVPGDGSPEVYGQFAHAAILSGDAVGFTCKVIPPIGKPVDGLFHTGAVNQRSTLTPGTTPPGVVNNELLGTFTGVTRIGALTLLRATLTKSAATANEGVWNFGGTLLLRKGDDIGGGIKITRIVRIWGVDNGQLLAHVQLSNRAQALILRQVDGNFLTLISTNTAAPEIFDSPTVTVATIQAIDVDPVNGNYVVLASLKGAASTTNQALWVGRTSRGNDTTLQAQRMPILKLRKGRPLFTTNTPWDTVRGITIKPLLDRTGVGARGAAQQITSDGRVLAIVTGDRRVQELVTIVDP